jgi:hypothetical protein
VVVVQGAMIMQRPVRIVEDLAGDSDHVGPAVGNDRGCFNRVPDAGNKIGKSRQLNRV